MLEAFSVIARGAPPAVAGRPGVLDRLRCRAEVALGRGVVVGDGEATEIGVGDGLDLAAELLECADLLADGGEGVAAFCLEGIEGRLLEALLDAGPLGVRIPLTGAGNLGAWPRRRTTRREGRSRSRATRRGGAERLGPDRYHVLREKGTDPPFTGEYTHPGRRGVFRCAACGNELFVSDMQFDSGSGWPSFTAPAAEDAVVEAPDHSSGSGGSR